MDEAATLASVLRRVVALNLAMLAAETAVALAVGSVSLLADSVDFGEDASLNLLVLAALRWPAAARARLGAVLAGVLLMPTFATAAMAVLRLGAPEPPSPLALALTTTAAFTVNATCAALLARQAGTVGNGGNGGSLMRAAFLSARNDMLANVAILAAAGLTALTRANWPDLVTGCAIGLLNAGAAWEVWQAARAERLASNA